MHPRILIAAFATASLAAQLSAQLWTLQAPATVPQTRRAGAMAHDLLNGRMIMYGGLLSPTAITNETWSWDGANWTQLTPSVAPPPRWGHKMVFDTRRLKLVAWGGRSPTTTATASDTWEFDIATATWAQVVTPTTPTARAFYAMAYDQRRGVVVTFGSQSTTNGAQTWEYDGTNWRLATPTTSPASRESPNMCYDAGRGVIVMFGGYYGLASAPQMYGDTWEYDGITWRQVTTLNSPAPRYRHAMHYDSNRGRVVLVAGYGSASFSDTWEYDGNDWTQVATVGPSRPTEAIDGYYPFASQSVYFGGSGPTGVTNETWTFAGATTAIAAPFGTGCTGTAGLPVVNAVTRPILGSTFQVTVDNVPASSGLTLLAQGFNNTFSSAVGSLPADLSAFGLGGCKLEVTTDAVVALPISGTSAALSIPIPNLPSLTNLQWFAQALTLDAGSANGFGTTSRALHAVLGS